MSAHDGALVGRFRGARHDASLVVLEGLHALKHAHRFGARITDVAIHDPDAAAALARHLAPDLLPVLDHAHVLPADVFAQLAPVAHATGVIALARRPAVDAGAVFAADTDAPIILLERPSHLANIGAAVRVAAAAGAAGLFTLGGEDPWRPAALRGGAGLQFALPCARITALPTTRRPLVAIDPDGDSLADGTLPRAAVFAFGSEREGLGPELLGRADARVRIPMREGVSSLNLATAVAVILYSRC